MAKRAKKTAKKVIATTAKQREMNRIATRQKRFDAGNAAQKRVMIARDVLELLATPSFRKGVTQGVYVDIRLKDVATAEDPKELQYALNQTQTLKDCRVCALGACFVSAVRLGNRYSQSASGDDPDGGFRPDYDENFWPHLEKYFSEEQMGLIEYAFESETANYEDELTAEQIWSARRFADGDPAWKVLQRIMENIIKNRGTFVLDPEKDWKREAKAIIDAGDIEALQELTSDLMHG